MTERKRIVGTAGEWCEMELLSPKAFPDLTEAECIAIQRQLAPLTVQRGPLTAWSVRTAAGVDIAYWQEGETERAVCCIVVIDCETGQVVEKRHAAGTVSVPYRPGCLAFRELPLVLEAAEGLSSLPELYLFDGNGILHPRGMGLATHASFYLNAPTAGLAKHYFRVEGASLTQPQAAAGSYSDIVKDGAVLGRALRTHQGVRPVYVSVGNRVDIDTVTALALRLTDRESRIPRPTRLADLETHIMRWALQGGPQQD